MLPNKLHFIKLVRQFQEGLVEFKFTLSHPRSKSFFESKTYNASILSLCLAFPVLNIFFNSSNSFLHLYFIFDVTLFAFVNLEMLVKLCFLRKEIFSFWLYKLEFGFILLLDLLALLKWGLAQNYSFSSFLFIKIVLSLLLLLNNLLQDSQRNTGPRKIIDIFFLCIIKMVQMYLLILVVCVGCICFIRFSHRHIGYSHIVSYLIK